MTDNTSPEVQLIIGNLKAGELFTIDNANLFRARRDFNLYNYLCNAHASGVSLTDFSSQLILTGEVDWLVANVTYTEQVERISDQQVFVFDQYKPTYGSILAISQLLPNGTELLSHLDLVYLACHLDDCPKDCEFSLKELLERNIDDITSNQDMLRTMIASVRDLEMDKYVAEHGFFLEGSATPLGMLVRTSGLSKTTGYEVFCCVENAPIDDVGNLLSGISQLLLDGMSIGDVTSHSGLVLSKELLRSDGVNVAFVHAVADDLCAGRMAFVEVDPIVVAEALENEFDVNTKFYQLVIGDKDGYMPNHDDYDMVARPQKVFGVLE